MTERDGREGPLDEKRDATCYDAGYVQSFPDARFTYTFLDNMFVLR